MTRDRLITADASQMSGSDFFRTVFGKPPLTDADRAKREAERKAYSEKLREENRRELEQLRDRLCAQASPKLAAEFRAKWAEDDARDEQRRMIREASEERRHAA